MSDAEKLERVQDLKARLL